MIIEQIWALLALLVMIALFVIGVRTSPRGFLYTFIGFLLIFTITTGNPVGLMVSVGGWIFLDMMLAGAVLVAFGVAYIKGRGSRATAERDRR